MLNSTILLAGLVGGAVGALLGGLKFRSPLVGAVLGAGAGALGAVLLAPSPRTLLAVEAPEEFRRTVLKCEQPVLVDFYSDRCPPCRRLAPLIEDLSGEYAGRMRFVKVDVEAAPELAWAHHVRAVPTLIVFWEGRSVRRWVGGRSGRFLRTELQRVLKECRCP
jgi:thioredoxin 1